MAYALRRSNNEVNRSPSWTPEARALGPRSPRPAPLCVGCRAHEARYAFHLDRDDPLANRRRTLCFRCFRVEVSRRRAVATWLERGQRAKQLQSSLDEVLRTLSLRRRRAQIAARHAVDGGPTCSRNAELVGRS